MEVPTMLTAVLSLAILAPQQEEELSRKIQKLVQDLGSEDFETREKAATELKKIGKAAADALKKAAESDDAEIRLRAKRILEEIERKKPQKRIGSSVSIQSSNGDTSYLLTPNEGDPITFKRLKSGGVELEYAVDGQKKTAKSESIEKFLEEHKGLAEKYGITKDGISYGGSRISFRAAPSFRFGGQDEEFWKKFEKDLEEWQKRFQERDWFWDPGVDPEEFEKEMDRLRKRAMDPDLDPEDFFHDWNRWQRRDSAHGAVLEPADEVLRAHLEIPEGTGLVVRRVREGSLAEQFGLRKNDILLDIDGTKVASWRDATKLLKKESTVTILRGGKKSERKIEEREKKDK
jgi:hypothetical protein